MRPLTERLLAKRKLLKALVHRNSAPRLTRRMHQYSTLYLALFLLALVLDRELFTT